MKKNLLFSFVILLVSMTMFSSCSNEDDTDIRDSYVGTYSGKKTYTNGGTNYSGDITVKVSKSDTPGIIIIESNFYKSSTAEYASAEVKNEIFSTAFTSLIDGVTETVSIFNGKIDGNTISYSFSTEGYVTITVSATKL
jgi:hypothetical protein